jgi:hypothetical protein
MFIRVVMPLKICFQQFLQLIISKGFSGWNFPDNGGRTSGIRANICE